MLQTRVIDRLVRVLLILGLAPPTYALVATTGRRSGRPGYRLDGILLRALAAIGGGNMMTVRIDLDPIT